jgi:hypothetical protein
MKYHPTMSVEAVQGWGYTKDVKDLLTMYQYDIYGITKLGKPCPLDSPDVFVSRDLIALPTEES